MQLDHTHFAALPCLLPYTCDLHPPRNKEEKERKEKNPYQVQFVLSIYSLELGHTTSGQPLKEN